jgi:antibiotic biosynthesis monooxygenase (ABM) superfamily enzyme
LGVHVEATRVLELVVYKLNQGVSREQFLTTNDAVSSWISRQPGFISRDLVYETDGDRWVDVIWWENAGAGACRQ